MASALNTYEAMKAFREREAGKEGEWKKSHARAWEIVQSIMELRRGE